MLNVIRVVLWPFRIIFRFIKWLLSSYIGEFARAKKERSSIGNDIPSGDLG